MTKLESIGKMGKLAKGRNELLNHLNGKILSRSQAMRAKCYECMGYYADGRLDCKILDCPLYFFNFYGSQGMQKRGLQGKKRSKTT